MSNKEWERVYSLLLKLNITDEHKAIAKHISSITNNTSIIDIGCGAGEYSICFSDYFSNVYSLDISNELINRLKKNKKNNMTTIASDYKSYNTIHDNSFISFCPVIQDIDDLKHIISNTKDYIFILTVDKGSRDYHRYNLMQLLPPLELKGFIKNADWFRSTLKELNINYKEELYSSTNEEKKASNDAIEYFSTYFEALGYKKEDVYNTIKDYINNNSIDGYITETHIMNKSLIYFKREA